MVYTGILRGVNSVCIVYSDACDGVCGRRATGVRAGIRAGCAGIRVI